MDDYQEYVPPEDEDSRRHRAALARRWRELFPPVEPRQKPSYLGGYA